MISQQGKRILELMYKNIKNAKQPQTIGKARENINAMAKMNGFSDKLILENIDLEMKILLIIKQQICMLEMKINRIH